ncbi:hypothetical protein ACVWXN_001422 [Bradyrhizobium sp. i1.4.4]
MNTTDNFIQAGYRLFEPEVPEASAHTLYWLGSGFAEQGFP